MNLILAGALSAVRCPQGLIGLYALKNMPSLDEVLRDNANTFDYAVEEAGKKAASKRSTAAQ